MTDDIPDDVVERAYKVYLAAHVYSDRNPLRAALRVAVEWERGEAKEQLRLANIDCFNTEVRAQAAEAKVAKLREALTKIVENEGEFNMHWAARIAQAAIDAAKEGK